MTISATPLGVPQRGLPMAASPSNAHGAPRHRRSPRCSTWQPHFRDRDRDRINHADPMAGEATPFLIFIVIVFAGSQHGSAHKPRSMPARRDACLPTVSHPDRKSVHSGRLGEPDIHFRGRRSTEDRPAASGILPDLFVSRGTVFPDGNVLDQRRHRAVRDAVTARALRDPTRTCHLHSSGGWSIPVTCRPSSSSTLESLPPPQPMSRSFP